jgi:hypothetical protein
MLKREVIWRAIATEAIEQKTLKFQQKELAGRFKFSLSTVSNALKPLRQIGAVKVGGRSFALTDLEKLLTFWATHRKLSTEILYQTHVPGGVRAVEGEIPPGVTFGAFSAYRIRFQDAPADYDKVYVYSRDLAELEHRFPKHAGYENLIALRADPYLPTTPTTPIAQIYVDLWNLPEWYAADYLNALKKRILPVL